MDRAYSVIEVKDLDEGRRVFSGVATTPAADRVGDIVNPLGVKYSNPLVLLHQHRSDSPIGTVKFRKPTKDGIGFEAEIPTVSEPGPLKDRVDTAWGEIKHGLVRAVSIGFRPLKYAYMKDGGIDYQEIEVFELSTVSIPANAEASIQTIKSIDEQLRAASGREQEPDPPPDVSGTKPAASRRFFFARNKGNDVKTVREQIEALEAARQAKAARMSEIMQKSIDEGRSTDEAEQDEFDGLEAEVKAAESDLKRLRTLESLQVAKAAPVKTEVGTDPEAATKARAGYITVQPNVEKGQDFVRFCMAAMQAKGNPLGALAIANARWKDANRVITSLKAAVDAGSTSDSTWASPLVEYQTMASEFIELLRPMTLMGRIPGGLRRVPFNVRMQRQTAGVTGSFVGEGMPKPVNELAFDAVTLGHHKAAVIVVMTMELARFSDPSAEAVVRQDLIDGLTAFLDKRFIDPQYSGSTSSPASITNGLVPINSTGATISAITQDVENLMAAFIAANLNLSRAVWIMSPSTALSLSMKRNNQDQFAFPTVTPDGGTFFGRPVLTSNHVAAAGSPTEQLIVLMDPSEIFLADDGGFSIDMSQEASLQMDSAPSAGAQSLVSLWQNNLAALRAERSINWMRRRDQAVQLLGNANW